MEHPVMECVLQCWAVPNHQAVATGVGRGRQSVCGKLSTDVPGTDTEQDLHASPADVGVGAMGRLILTQFLHMLRSGWPRLS